jgi:TusA-related sulfurtransferase
MGTHNRVLKLGHGQYLEVIAIDPQAQPPDVPRWFDLDNPNLQASLKGRPRLIAWVARTERLAELAPTAYGQPAVVRPMQRGDWHWHFAFTENGALPGGGLIPHLIQWDGDLHPTDLMADSGCRLAGLDGACLDPVAMQRSLSSMGLDDSIRIRLASGRQPTGLYARIRTPAGDMVLI